MTKLSSHIGLRHKNRHAEMFTFQLLNPSGSADATVDFVDGLCTRCVTTQDLTPRRAAIIRLGKIHLNRWLKTIGAN